MSNDHHHSHSHSHHHHGGSHDEKKVLVAFCIIFVFMIVEAIGGLLSGSLALLADAGHMFTDAAALALAYAAFRFGRREADQKRTFGYLRFEVLAGFINALTLFVIVLWIAYKAYQRFTQPPEILAGPMLVVAVLGLLINIFVFWYLTRGGSEHINIKGAALHVMGDLLGSLGAILAALVIYFTNWTPIDPILSVLVSLLILRSAWGLLGSSLHILLEGAPPDALPVDIERHLKEHVPHLQEIRHVHVWLITSGHPIATLHVRPSEDIHAKAVTKAVVKELKTHFNIEHVTVAIDWNDDESKVESCSLS